MPNHHVICLEALLAQTTVEFLFEKSADGADLVPVTVKPKTDGLLLTDSDLDLALFELTAESADVLVQ